MKAVLDTGYALESLFKNQDAKYDALNDRLNAHINKTGLNEHSTCELFPNSLNFPAISNGDLNYMPEGEGEHKIYNDGQYTYKYFRGTIRGCGYRVTFTRFANRVPFRVLNLGPFQNPFLVYDDPFGYLEAYSADWVGCFSKDPIGV